jgi:hypothetical protein
MNMDEEIVFVSDARQKTIDEIYQAEADSVLPEAFFTNEMLYFNLEMFQLYQEIGIVEEQNGNFMQELISVVLMQRGMNG